MSERSRAARKGRPRPAAVFLLLGSLSAASAPAAPGPAPLGPRTTPAPTVAERGREGLPAALARDARTLFTRPLHLDRAGWAKAAAVATAAASLQVLRDDLRDLARDRGGPGTDRFLRDVRTMGKGGVAPALAASFLLASLGTGDRRERETALLLLESAAYSALVARAGSFVFATDRPREGDRIRFFRAGGHGVSLDAALAASIVEPLRRQYLVVQARDGPWRKTAKRTGAALLYAGAALTAYQRVRSDAHWAPDAFLGAMTGLFVGGILCDAHGKPGRAAVEPVAGRLQSGAVVVGIRVRL